MKHNFYSEQCTEYQNIVSLYEHQNEELNYIWREINDPTRDQVWKEKLFHLFTINQMFTNFSYILLFIWKNWFFFTVSSNTCNLKFLVFFSLCHSQCNYFETAIAISRPLNQRSKLSVVLWCNRLIYKTMNFNRISIHYNSKIKNEALKQYHVPK